MEDVDAIYPLRGEAAELPAEVRTEVLGGKAANLAELGEAGFPVPDGFVVTAGAYRRFLGESGLEARLFDAVDAGADDPEAVAEAAERARELVVGAVVPEELREAVGEAYAALGEGARVAVRSSATAEDLPEASFAGQQDTFLNVSGVDAVVDRIRECWASLFTERALAYREERGFADDAVAIAVVVQEMVDAEKSGVLFTADPATGAAEMTIEAAPGLGEAVVSGAVSPDSYVLDRGTGEVVSETINAQEVMYVADGGGGTVAREVPADLRERRVLDPDELDALVGIGERIERHYGAPQDVEWAIRDGEVVVLQSRPITTIRGESAEATAERGDGPTFEGMGASGGVAVGSIRLDPVEAAKRSGDGEDVILVRKTTSPSDLHGMKAAVGILTTRGGTTSHAAIVARELDKPAVVGCETLTVDYDAGRIEAGDYTFEPGDRVRVDGDAGTASFPDA